jgi:hypothetical protein
MSHAHPQAQSPEIGSDLVSISGYGFFSSHGVSSHGVSSHGVSSHGVSSHGVSSHGVSSDGVAIRPRSSYRGTHPFNA